jgi:hypothetical protein
MPGRSRATVPPEADLLLCCGRPDPTPESAQRLAVLLGAPLDWAIVLRLAHGHGLMPLLHWHLHRLPSAPVPASVRDRLREHFLGNTRHNLLFAGELLRLLKLFATERIDAIPIKGPTLAAQAYGNLALREFTDLDVLIRRAHFPRARDLLCAQGYELPWPLTPRREKSYLAGRRELPLVRPDIDCSVELHTHLTARHFPYPIDLDGVFERARRTSLNGTEVPTLGAEDLVLFLCVHGAKHRWGGLGWICDVALVLDLYPTLNWPWLLEQARKRRCERIVLLGLLLAHELLAAPLPRDVLHQTRRNSWVTDLNTDVQRRLFDAREQTQGGVGNALFQLRCREYVSDGLGYVLNQTLVPAEADWHLLTLPPPLEFLYYLVRPIRLTLDLAQRVVRR